jgi:hypothetical protein
MYFSRELFALISIVFALVRKFATARDRAREGLMMMVMLCASNELQHSGWNPKERS